MSKLFEQFGAEYSKGDIIFQEGDPAEDLFMIHQGQVQISRRAGVLDKEITVIEDPEFFGEMALISSEPRSATAVAHTDLKLIRMSKKAFETAIRENSSMAASVVRLLTRRLRATDEFVSRVVEKHTQEAVFSELLRICLSSGKKDASRKWILVPSDEALASIAHNLDLSEPRLRKLLPDLKKEKGVAVKKDGQGGEWIGIPLS